MLILRKASNFVQIYRRISFSVVQLKKIRPFKTKHKNPCITITNKMTLKELSDALKKSHTDLLYCFDYLGIHKYKNESDQIEDMDVIAKVVKLSGYRFKIGPEPTEKKTFETIEDIVNKRIEQSIKNNESISRPPIVTVMGHVDHGKTTLLDTIRKTKVVDSEFGGITQKIGAFSVHVNKRKITFIDTPGHAAFVSMRERGTCVTDLVVLVVAADDGIMPQTKECIRHINRYNVPYIVAINKIDKHNADVESTIRSLLHHGIQIDASGGDILSVQISALKGQNIDSLLEAIILQADDLNLKAPVKSLTSGFILESHKDQTKGPTTSLIIQTGSLKKNQQLVADCSRINVKKIFDDCLNECEVAYPSTPIILSGWKGFPHLGTRVIQVEDEREAKKLIEYRLNQKKEHLIDEASKQTDRIRKSEREAYRKLLEYKRSTNTIFKKDRSGPSQIVVNDSQKPRLPLIIRADTEGSLEAIINILETYPSDQPVEIDVVNFAVGEPTSTDFENIKASANGIIYCFNLTATTSNSIRNFKVIYHLINDIESELKKRVPMEDFEEMIGCGVVKKVFRCKDENHRKPFVVAGCQCTFGQLRRADLFHVLRNNEIIHTDTAVSMKHFENDVTIVNENTECGIALTNTKDIEINDVLKCFRVVPRPMEICWTRCF